jgi:hypothetical protein
MVLYLALTKNLTLKKRNSATNGSQQQLQHQTAASGTDTGTKKNEMISSLKKNNQSCEIKVNGIIQQPTAFLWP